MRMSLEVLLQKSTHPFQHVPDHGAVDVPLELQPKITLLSAEEAQAEVQKPFQGQHTYSCYIERHRRCCGSQLAAGPAGPGSATGCITASATSNNQRTLGARSQHVTLTTGADVQDSTVVQISTGWPVHLNASKASGRYV